MRTELAPGLWAEYEEAGHGRPVVLLHAFPLASAMWRPQLAALADRHRVIAPNLPGFGGSGGFNGTSSIELMADFVVQLLDALRVQEPIVLGGLSMGGYVALNLARRHAERLRGLILADTRAEPDSEEAKNNRDKLMAFAEKHSPVEVIEQLLPKMVSEETRRQRPEVVAEVRRLAAAQTPAAIIGALQALRDRPDAVPVLGIIQVPTLVLVGSDDQLTPPAMAETLAKGIRGARLTILPGAGHLANLECAEMFNAEVRAFLQSLT